MITFWTLLVISSLGTFYVLPHSIRKLSQKNIVVNDMYKKHRTVVPTNAGMIVLFTSFIAIAVLPLMVRILNILNLSEENFYDLSEINLALLLVVSIYSLYGLIDDLLDIGQKLKLFLPIIFGYPLISLIHPEQVWLPFIGDFDLNTNVKGDIMWSDLFRIIIIPLYVMVVSNLVNMYSGYNGLRRVSK